jgi:hypothetical protein
MRQASDPHYKGAAAAAHVDGDNTAKRKADPVAAAAATAAADGEPTAKRARAATSSPAGAGAAAGEVDPDAPSGGAEPGRPPLPSDPVERAAKYKEFYPGREQSTAFIKNLPFKCTEEELGGFLDARGGTVTARIVRDKATVGTRASCSQTGCS